MKKNNLRIIIESIIGIVLIVFAIKFFFYLLPIILILIGVYIVYNSFYKNKHENNNTVHENKTNKKKQVNIPEAEIVKETEEK